MLIYLLLYNFLCFMFMLNFIIAIICESYLAVTAIVKKSEADQEFFTDIVRVTMMAIKSSLFRWPKHTILIYQPSILKRKRVGYNEMRMLFPDIQPNALAKFMRHYAAFEPIKRQSEAEHSDIADAHTHTRTLLITQMSVMLGVPVPTLHEQLSESKHLQKKSFRDHVNEITRVLSLAQSINHIGPQLERTMSLLVLLTGGDNTVLADKQQWLPKIQHLQSESLLDLLFACANQLVISPRHAMASIPGDAKYVSVTPRWIDGIQDKKHVQTLSVASCIDAIEEVDQGQLNQVSSSGWLGIGLTKLLGKSDRASVP